MRRAGWLPAAGKKGAAYWPGRQGAHVSPTCAGWPGNSATIAVGQLTYEYCAKVLLSRSAFFVAGPAQCDLRVGDATYMPRTLAAPSPTTAEREKRKEREEKIEKKFGARVARAATTGYLHREGQN